MEDYYSILGISKDASQDEVKKAYRKLALQWHPDKNPKNLEEANRKFKELAEAYEVLGNAERRRSYDLSGGSGGGRRNGHSSRFSSRFRPPGHSGADGGYHDDDEAHDMMDDDDAHFFSYNFRSPEEIFQEFFGADNPLSDFFEQALNPFFGFPGAGPDRDGRSTGQAFSFNSWEVPGGEVNHHTSWIGDRHGSRNSSGNSRRTSNFTSTSTSTRFVNGKKVTTKKKIENGVETTTVYENDILKSRTVNRSSNSNNKHIDFK